jgi:hypothetical protein
MKAPLLGRAHPQPTKPVRATYIQQAPRPRHSWQQRIRLMGLTVVCILLGVAIASFAVASTPGPSIPSYVFDNFQSDTISSGEWHVAQSFGHYAVTNGMLHLWGRAVAIERSLRMNPIRTVAIVRVRPWRATIFGMSLKSWDGKAISVELDDQGLKCGRSTQNNWQPVIFVSWPLRHQAPWFTGRWFTLELVVQHHPFHVTCLAYDAQGLLIGDWTFRHFTFPYGNLSLLALGTMNGGNNYDITSIYAGPTSGAPGLGLSQAPPHLLSVSPVTIDGTVSVSGSGQPGERVDILDNGVIVAHTQVATGGVFTATINTSFGSNTVQAEEHTSSLNRIWKSNIITFTR